MGKTTKILVDGKASRYHPLYYFWKSMKDRCYKPTAKAYKNYGGRGIAMHTAWIMSFPAFARDVDTLIGQRPSKNHSIDRFDNNGNYVPGNIRWATSKQQTRNARYNRLITVNDKTQTIVEWCEETGIPKTTLYKRISSGMPPEIAISTSPLPTKNIKLPRGWTMLCKKAGLKHSTVYNRVMRFGWTLEKALSEPPEYQGK